MRREERIMIYGVEDEKNEVDPIKQPTVPTIRHQPNNDHETCSTMLTSVQRAVSALDSLTCNESTVYT